MERVCLPGPPLCHTYPEVSIWGKAVVGGTLDQEAALVVKSIMNGPVWALIFYLLHKKVLVGDGHGGIKFLLVFSNLFDNLSHLGNL